MSSRINLAHVLADLGPTYNSVNVRTAAYRIEGAWYSLITVIRFSEQNKEQVESTTAEAWRQLRSVSHERLRIEQRNFSYDDREQLFGMFKSGTVETGDTHIQLGRPVDLLSDLGYIKPPAFGDVSCRWPSLQVQASTSQLALDQRIRQTIMSVDSADEDLRRYLSTRAYASLSEVVASFLGLNKNSHLSYGSEIYLWVPILADVKQARWSPQGSLSLTYEAHPAVKTQFWLSARVSTNGSDQHELPLSPTIEGSGEWEMQVESGHIEDETARVDVALVHQSLGIINNHAWFVRDLIPHKKMHPLWALLQRFCSADEFARLLAVPGQAQDSENRPQRLFEMRVSWILSAFGFVSVLLGPHECLRDPGTRVERGSLDLIAFHEQKRVLILGACKINSPKESDYDNLVNMRTLLLDDFEGRESFNTFTVVFTAAAEARLYKELETSGSGFFPRVIPVFDAQRFKAGIAALQNQQMDWIFEQLSGAMPSFQS